MSSQSENKIKGSKYPGIFIAIEGIDGAGKTTVARLLSEILEERLSQDILLTSEPTKGKIGKLLREYLISEKAKKEVDALLFAADRVEHYHNEILPQLQLGNVVITDRYVYSSFAYQSTQGISLEWLKEINRFVDEPDLVFFLDVPIEVALTRLEEQKRNQKEKFETKVFLTKVKEIYDTFLDLPNIIRINADRPLNKIVNDLADMVVEILER